MVSLETNPLFICTKDVPDPDYFMGDQDKLFVTELITVKAK